MNKIYTLGEDDLRGGLYGRIYLLIGKNRWTWKSVGAAFGIAGGMLSMLSALLLWATVRFLASVGVGLILSTLDNVLFTLPLPLLALGAYCLDLLETQLPILPPPAKSRPSGFKGGEAFGLANPHHN